ELLQRGDFQKTGSNPAKKYLTFEEAAAYLDVAHSTLYKYNSEKAINYFNRGKKLYYDQKDLDDFIQRYRKQTAAEFTAQSLNNLRNRKN
ncbi:MAG: Helix-turn-helix domain, partial [Bacteroidota bacterium]